MGWWNRLQNVALGPLVWEQDADLSAMCSWVQPYCSKSTVSIWGWRCRPNLLALRTERACHHRVLHHPLRLALTTSQQLGAHWAPHIVILDTSNAYNTPLRWTPLWPFHRWEKWGSEERADLIVSFHERLADSSEGRMAHVSTLCIEFLSHHSLRGFPVSVSSPTSILSLTCGFLGSLRTLTSCIRLLTLPQSKTLRALQSW